MSTVLRDQYYQARDPATESLVTRRRIIEHNRKLIMNDRAAPNQLINFSVPLNLPKLYPMNTCIKSSIRAIPKLPLQTGNRPEFAFYNRTFRFLYFYIGKKNVGIWEDFKIAYEELVPKQNRPLENMIDPQNRQKLIQKLGGFVKSGIQLRILIQKSAYQSVSEIMESFIQSEQILSVTIQRQSRVNLIKTKIIYSLRNLFTEEIKRLIKISTKKKVSLQYNFISLQAKSSEISHRRILLQQCIKPKQPYQYLQTHKKFTNMMKNYQNQKALSRIDQLLQEKSLHKDISSEIQKQKSCIKQIQQQQQKFCADLQKYLSKQDPIELQNNCKQIFFKIIDMYKQQTSIYEVINTNIRLSINVNETNMKCLSTIIKYLDEGVRYFFLLLRHKFQHKMVYRGCRMSDEEFQVLETGSIVMNLGFMSTSCSEQKGLEFMSKDNSGCLLIVEIGQEEMKSEQDQEGFACLQHIYQHMKKDYGKLKGQKEVLFNPLNIFEVIKKQTIKKSGYNQRNVYLRYSPHIRLANKINSKTETATADQIKKYNSIKANITSLTRTSYDRGKILHLKGESSKALEHYKQVEETKGETLTIQQQFNKIQILNQIKDFDQMDKCLNKLIKSYQQKVEEIKNPQLLTPVQKKQNLIETINLLTKQSEILQMSSNYLQAEQRAQKAMEESKALSDQMLIDNKKITDKQFIQSLMLDIKSTVLLAKSKCQTNDTENSLVESYDGLTVIQQVYKRYDESILPKINKLVKQADIPVQADKKLTNISKIRQEKRKFMKQQQKNLKKQLNRIKSDKVSNRKQLKDSVRNSNIENIGKTIQKYLNSQRQSKKNLLELYYPAYKEIEEIKKNSNTFKLAKNALYELKQFLDELVDYEYQFYSIIKQNLKSAKQDIKPCLQNQRRILEHRFGKFLQFEEILRKNQNTELNTEDIKNYNHCVAFLLEYTEIIENKETQKLKDIRASILKHLNKKVQKQSISNNIKLTAQKTLILESQSQQFKNMCYDANIIENQSNKLQNSLRSTKDTLKNSIKTISSYKSRQSFIELRKKLDQLQKIHEEDKQINKFYFLLKDLNDYLELLNNSYSVAQSTQEYNQWLVQANRKAETFQQKYELSKMKINETLVKHYYLKAQTQFKRGYYKQARNFLTKAQDFLQRIYERKIGTKQEENKFSRSDRLAKLKSDTLNKLFAREITIECYRLQAELFGIYYGSQKRLQLLEQLRQMKKFVQKNAPNKVITQALINQAVAFLALRCIPSQISNRNTYQTLYLDAGNSLKQSIKLRSGLFGNQNQYLAIAYSNLVTLQKTKSKPNSSTIEKYYQRGINIYHSLDEPIPKQTYTYLDKQPILYLYRMELESIYKEMFDKKNKDSIGQAYCKNIDNFQKNSKDLKSLYIAQNIMNGASKLIQFPAYTAKSQVYLQRCQKQIENIVTMNKINENQEQNPLQNIDENNEELIIMQIKSKLFENFVSCYEKLDNPKKKKKYLQLKQKIVKIINQKLPPPPPQPPKKKQKNFFEISFDILNELIYGKKQKPNKASKTPKKKQKQEQIPKQQKKQRTESLPIALLSPPPKNIKQRNIFDAD